MNDISTVKSNQSGQGGFLPNELPNIFKMRNMSIPSPPTQESIKARNSSIVGNPTFKLRKTNIKRGLDALKSVHDVKMARDVTQLQASGPSSEQKSVLPRGLASARLSKELKQSDSLPTLNSPKNTSKIEEVPKVL